MILRGRLEELYQKHRDLVLQELLLKQADDPSADLNEIVAATVAEVRRKLRQR